MSKNFPKKRSGGTVHTARKRRPVGTGKHCYVNLTNPWQSRWPERKFNLCSNLHAAALRFRLEVSPANSEIAMLSEANPGRLVE